MNLEIYLGGLHIGARFQRKRLGKLVYRTSATTVGARMLRGSFEKFLNLRMIFTDYVLFLF